MLVDSHCHLDFDAFAEDLDAIVARAGEAGVGRLLTISTRPSQAPVTRAIAERYPSVFWAAGVHPHYADDEGPITSIDSLTALARHPKMVGIGETGLDFYYDNSDRAAQEASFRVHCKAARELDLPVIVHTRDADADTVRVLEEEAAGGDAAKPLRGVIHCFSGGKTLAEGALALGFYISFSGILTFNRSEDIRAIAADVPMDRLLVETDAPYLAPVPQRGKRNEPAFVAHTAAVLARVKDVTTEEIASRITDNFLTLFNNIPS